jgi:hypothetical protein
MLHYSCSGQEKPESWGRHSKALDNLGSGNLEGGGIGERVEKGEVSLQATWDQGGRILSVRERMGRVRNVVLMNVYLDLENPGGRDFGVGGYMSQVREMGELVYEQPGNEVDGSCHNKEGSK